MNLPKKGPMFFLASYLGPPWEWNPHNSLKHVSASLLLEGCSWFWNHQIGRGQLRWTPGNIKRHHCSINDRVAGRKPPSFARKEFFHLEHLSSRPILHKRESNAALDIVLASIQLMTLRHCNWMVVAGCLSAHTQKAWTEVKHLNSHFLERPSPWAVSLPTAKKAHRIMKARYVHTTITTMHPVNSRQQPVLSNIAQASLQVPSPHDHLRIRRHKRS